MKKEKMSKETFELNFPYECNQKTKSISTIGGNWSRIQLTHEFKVDEELHGEWLILVTGFNNQIHLKLFSKNSLEDLTYDMEVLNLDFEYPAARLARVEDGLMEKVSKGTYISFVTNINHPEIPYIQLVYYFNILVKLKIKYSVWKPPKTKLRPPITGPSFAKRMKTMLFDEDTSDAVIICGNEKLLCHKLVLCSASKVFKSMFLEDAVFNEAKNGTLEIKDFSAKTMRTFLTYLYTDSIGADEIDVDLLRAADKYDLERLVSECVSELFMKINPENILEIIETAHLLNLTDLYDEVLSKLKNGMKPTNQDGFNDLVAKYPAIAQDLLNSLLFQK